MSGTEKVVAARELTVLLLRIDHFLCPGHTNQKSMGSGSVSQSGWMDERIVDHSNSGRCIMSGTEKVVASTTFRVPDI
jgi:hypothetical protein